MGVHGLWQLLHAAGQPVSLESLEGKVLAVDVSIWLHQTMKGMRDKDGNPLPNAHLQGLFSRVCKLLFYSIKPVFVFDGGVPLLKKQTMAARRERKAEAVRESNDIAHKLLRNLVQSNAVKQALSVSGKPPRPVPGVQRRNQEKDIFELAPLPETEEIGLSLNAEEWERDFELQEKCIKEGLASLSEAHPESEEFKSLPMEIQHEILHEWKERNKYHSLSSLTKMPEDSDSFSSYQLKKLMKQSKLSSRIEEVRKEMSSKTATNLTYSLGDDYYGDEVESRRIVSEDAAHYVLIKGLTKRKQEEEAEKYELQSRVKLEKVEEEEEVKAVVDSCKTSKTSPPVNYEEPEVMSTSSDSDSGIETFVNQRKNWSVGKKRKSKISRPTNKKGKDSHTEFSKVNSLKEHSTTDDNVNRSLQELKNEDSSSEGEFIEVTINPNATVEEDDLFPASIFQLSNQPNDGEKDACNVEKIFTPASSFAADTSVERENADQCGDGMDPGITNVGLIKDVPGYNEDIIAKRKSILDDIRNELARKKESVEATCGDVDANIDEDTVIAVTKINANEVVADLDYSTSGGFLHEESSEEENAGISSNINNVGNAEYDANSTSTFDVMRSPEHALTYSPKILKNPANISISKSSDSDDDLKLAIELSLQTAKQEKKSAVEDKVPSSNVSEEESSDDDTSVAINNEQETPMEDTYNQNSDSTPPISFTTPISPTKKMTAESVSPSKGLIRPQPEDFDEADIRGDSFHNLNEEDLMDINSYLASERETLVSEQGKQNRFATSVTDQINQEAQELLKLFGIPYIVSPMEAEAQCAFLDITGQTHGTITDDSDIWLFGGRRMYKNFFNQSKYVEMYSLDNIRNHFGLSREQLINIALLCGSDYTEGLQGVGPVRALEIMAEFPGDGIEGLLLFRKWWDKAKKKMTASSESKLRARLKDLKLVPGFPSEAVVNAYLNPEVDESREKFTWRLPELDLLREFAKIKFGWNREKTDQSLLPMMKQLNQKEHQKRISSYFQPESFIKTSKIKSERLKKALDLVNNPLLENESSSESDASQNGEVVEKKRRAEYEGQGKTLEVKSKKKSANLSECTADKSGYKTLQAKTKGSKKAGQKTKPTNKNKSKETKTTRSKKLTQESNLQIPETSLSVESACDIADDFMTNMAQKVLEANKELTKEIKPKTLAVECVQDVNSGPPKHKMLVSLDRIKPHRGRGGMGFSKRAKVKTGVVNLSESSSESEKDDTSKLTESEMKSKKRNFKGNNLNVSPSSKKTNNLSANKVNKIVPTSGKVPSLNQRQNLLKSSSTTKDGAEKETLPSSNDRSSSISSRPAALAGSLLNVDTPEGDIRSADVSIINKKNLPETLAFLNQRSKEEKLILQQLKGGHSLNSVERRLEADEKRPKFSSLLSAAPLKPNPQKTSFEDLLAGMDNVAKTDVQKRSNRKVSETGTNLRGNDIKNKRTENDANYSADFVVNKTKSTSSASKKLSKNIGFGSSDESFDMDTSLDLLSAMPSERSFKTKKALRFDQPIGGSDEEDTGTKTAGKKNKFRQQMKHLNDSRSIRGHGVLPYSGKNDQVRGRSFAGKGKGRGKNRQKMSPYNTIEDEIMFEEKVRESFGYEALTEADLGSDFSDCD
ncbi:DNA excision repair protein ERCC-5-like [Biomphalaria glabrata]|uniref:DNA excision repair protein ERCC-5-like n=1 Tax=Biomphalaria glabrata TaxID=6526 RepID=A0A9W2Z1N7_BIOGL|nr:DNA excision repair protein ERCC-5-like [Biomphalaria glabrata]